MNTDDLFNSSCRTSPSEGNTKDCNDYKQDPSSLIDEALDIINVDQSLSLQKENDVSQGLKSSPVHKNNLLESSSHFFKNATITIPNEEIPNFEKHRAVILQMATFFQTGTISDTLLVLLIVQNSALDLDHLANEILSIVNSCPEHNLQELNIKERIQRLADWEYYGIEGALENEKHLQLFRWKIKSVSSESAELDDSIKKVMFDLQIKRETFKTDLNLFYSKLKDEEKINIRKRKGILHETPAKRQKSNSSVSTGGKKSQKFSAAEKQLREKEKLNKLLEKEAERKKKEEEKLQREEEKAKKLEEKQRAQMEKEAARLKLLEEKTRKQQEKDMEKKIKDEAKAAKEAEKQKKELLRLKEDKAQKKLSGFFKPIEKKPVVLPAEKALSEFNAHFHPFTPKSTSIVAPINRFDHQIDLNFFDQGVKAQNIDAKKLFKEFRGYYKALVRGVCRTPRTLESLIEKNSWRYLKFAEDIRPPYYGTWTKKSRKVSGKTPFNHDPDIFDYEVDSEAEWEEDEPGEELVSEDEEVDGKDEEDEDQEDGWLVPHGYLSDDEGDAPEQDVDEPHRGKAKSLQLKVIQMLVPIISPPSYTYEGIPSELKVEILYDVKNPFQLDPSTLDTKKKASGLKKSTFPADLTDDLLKFIVENEFLPLPKLIDGFITMYLNRNLTKVSVESEIKKIAVKGKKGNDSKIRWYQRPGLLTESKSC